MPDRWAHSDVRGEQMIRGLSAHVVYPSTGTVSRAASSKAGDRRHDETLVRH